jgi:hypothetical protein
MNPPNVSQTKSENYESEEQDIANVTTQSGVAQLTTRILHATNQELTTFYLAYDSTNSEPVEYMIEEDDIRAGINQNDQKTDIDVETRKRMLEYILQRNT